MALPFLVRLPSALHCRADRMRARLGRLAKAHRCARDDVLGRFGFRCDERQFATDLLERKTHLWVFRADQRRRCGDFVVVDMSAPRGRARRVFGLELKLGAPASERGGLQMQNLDRALHALDCVDDWRLTCWTGGRRALMAQLA